MFNKAYISPCRNAAKKHSKYSMNYNECQIIFQNEVPSPVMVQKLQCSQLPEVNPQKLKNTTMRVSLATSRMFRCIEIPYKSSIVNTTKIKHVIICFLAKLASRRYCGGVILF